MRRPQPREPQKPQGTIWRRSSTNLLGVLVRRETSQEEVYVGLDVVGCWVDACLGDPVEDGRPKDYQQEDGPEKGLDDERRIDRAQPAPADLIGEPTHHQRRALTNDLAHHHLRQLR